MVTMVPACVVDRPTTQLMVIDGYVGYTALTAVFSARTKTRSLLGEALKTKDDFSYQCVLNLAYF